MSEILLPYKDTFRVMGLSRTSFDNHVRPHVRSVRTGRRLMFNRNELEGFAMERLGSGNIAI